MTNDITAHYQVEIFSYYPNLTDSLDVKIRHATTTVGSQIVSPQKDCTGIMVWPATHLLCQYVCSSPKLGERVLELGCGCGVVGVTAALSHPTCTWVSTDMDPTALTICRENYKLNGIQGMVRTLTWASLEQIHQLQHELYRIHKHVKFDVIVGADILYPATCCGHGLINLFETVDMLLSEEGTFVLSFCTRDGHRTPQHLIAAASNAGFTISSLPPLDPALKKKLPPLLDAKILVLKRSENASQQNKELGGDDCTVFPGLVAAIARAEEESSDEEWEAPFDGESDSYLLE